MKKILINVFILLSFTLQARAASLDTLAGKALFQKNCTSCHAIQARIVGPALHNVYDRHSEAWIIKFVHSSQTMIKSGDTSAVNLFAQFNQTMMPDHPTLGDNDIKNIIAYIRSESNPVTAPLPSTATVDQDDPYKGESGFVKQVIYVDLPGTHVPIAPGDYGTWLVIGSLVFLLLFALYAIIKSKALIISLIKKYSR